MADAATELFPHTLTRAQQKQLREFSQRIDYVNDEIEQAQESLTSIYEDVEEAGYDKKILKRAVKERKRSREERDTEQAKLDLYLHAIGDADDPLTAAARPLAEAVRRGEVSISVGGREFGE